ncbi:hypothetical protein O0L34_g296 [Tuta absoluta]|nr:hypothetical protein O0L34_g296 [Tuta absoluta]
MNWRPSPTARSPTLSGESVTEPQRDILSNKALATTGGIFTIPYHTCLLPLKGAYTQQLKLLNELEAVSPALSGESFTEPQRDILSNKALATTGGIFTIPYHTCLLPLKGAYTQQLKLLNELEAVSPALSGESFTEPQRDILSNKALATTGGIFTISYHTRLLPPKGAYTQQLKLLNELEAVSSILSGESFTEPQRDILSHTTLAPTGGMKHTAPAPERGLHTTTEAA